MNPRRRNILIAAVVVLLLLLGIVFVDPHDNPHSLHTDNPNLPASVAALPEVFVKPEPAKVKALVGRKEDFKFELELDSRSILPSEELSGTAYLTNNSTTDVSIWSYLPYPQGACLHFNVFDANNKLIVNEYYGVISSPMCCEPREFVFAKGKRERIRFGLSGFFDKDKRIPGKYKIVVHYGVTESLDLTSNEETFVIREK